jgi:hypothetical protein
MTIQRYSTDDWWPDPEGKGVLFEDHEKALRQAVLDAVCGAMEHHARCIADGKRGNGSRPDNFCQVCFEIDCDDEESCPVYEAQVREKAAAEAMRKACIARVAEYLEDEYSPAQLLDDLWDLKI